MADVQVLGNGAPDGTTFGRSDDLLSLYGAAPVAKGAAPAATVTAGSTTTVCNTAVAEIQVYLKNLGVTA